MIRTENENDFPYLVVCLLWLVALITVAVLALGFHMFSPYWLILAVPVYLILTGISLFVWFAHGCTSRSYRVELANDMYFIASEEGQWIGENGQPIRYSNGVFYYTPGMTLYFFSIENICTSFLRSLQLSGLPGQVNFNVYFLVDDPVFVIKKKLCCKTRGGRGNEHTLEKRVYELFKMIHFHIPDEVINRTCLSVSKGEVTERDKLLEELKQSMQKQFDLNNLGCKVNSVTMSL